MKEDVQHAREVLEQLRDLQCTGKVAASMLNELEGWKRMPSLPTRLMDWFANTPDELFLHSIQLHRPCLLRPLPPDAGRNPAFRQSLAAAGHIDVEVRDAGEGKGKYALPRFLDSTNDKFSPPFIIEPTPSPEKVSGMEEIPVAVYNQWKLTSMLDLEWIWADHCFRTDTEYE